MKKQEKAENRKLRCENYECNKAGMI